MAERYFEDLSDGEFLDCKKFVVTSEGLDLLSKNPDRIDSKLLKKLYQEETPGNSLDNDSEIDFAENDITDKTPEEIIGIQSEIIKQSLSKDFLSYISQIEPEQFEQLVVDLLLVMGYPVSQR